MSQDANSAAVSDQELKEIVVGSTDQTCIDLDQLTIHPPGRNAPLCDRISLRVDKGDIFAILGPSGCGKSTLFSFLSHRLRKIDDWNVVAKRCVVPNNVVLVPQHDVFYPHDTPVSALAFVYQKNYLCDRATAIREAEDALRLVGLTQEDKWHHSIGEAGYDSSLTGGERRLLAVARALMNKPDAILLDEPSTGLDTWTALSVVRRIKEVGAKSKCTFIMTLHQPSDALVALFEDRVLRLSPPLPMAAPEGLDRVAYTPLKDNNTIGGTILLLSYLVWRVGFRSFKNPASLLLRLISGLMLGILIGVAFVQLPYDDARYVQDVIGMCMGIACTTFCPILFSSTLFPLEKAHFMDEHPLRNGATLFVDSLARFFIDVIQAAMSVSLTLIAAPIIGIDDVGGLFLTVWLQSWASDAFGLFISTLAAPHVSVGTLIPTLGFISCAIGTGIMAPKKEGSGWIYHVMEFATFFKYGSNALALQELPRITNKCTTCFYEDGEAGLRALELTGDHFHTTREFQWMMLILIAVGFRLLSLISINVLVARGASHFYYTKSSAGAAFKPADDIEDTKDDSNTPSSEASNDGKPHPYVFKVSDVMESFHPRHLKRPKKTVMKKKRIVLQPSTFTAVLGPTGCGKSVLLQAMAARLGAGLAAVAPESPAITGHSNGNVNVQFDDGRDAFPRFMTVLEAAMQNARMHFPKMSESELEDHCMVHLTAFGLAPKKSDSVHKLSGGETKRMQVVVKLVTCPEILILDEPTAGLDSLAADALLRHLRKVARNGMNGEPVTIICSMKQPEPENTLNFDSFIFLSDNGEVLVEGTADECRSFFEIPPSFANVWADAALLRIHGQAITHLIPDAPESASSEPFSDDHPSDVYHNNWTGNSEGKADDEGNDVADEQPAGNALTRPTAHLSFGRAFIILAKRDVQQRWVRAPAETVAVFLMRYCMIPAIFAILLWDVGSEDQYFQNRYALHFMFAASHMFTTFINTSVRYPLERPLFEGEILGNMYTPQAYLGMMWFGPGLFEDIVGCTLACIIMKFCTGMELNFGWMLLSLLVLSQASIGIATILGQLRSIVLAAGLAVAALLPMMFAGTVMVTVRQMARTGIFRMMEAISLVRSTTLIMLHSELEETNDAYPSQFFALYGLDNPTWWYRIDVQWGILCFWLIVFRIMASIIFIRQFKHALPAGSK